MINSTAFSIPNFEEKGIENVQLYCESVENTTFLQHLFTRAGFWPNELTKIVQC